MPTLTIDGTEYEVAEGRTILQAIDDLGEGHLIGIHVVDEDLDLTP